MKDRLDRLIERQHKPISVNERVLDSAKSRAGIQSDGGGVATIRLQRDKLLLIVCSCITVMMLMILLITACWPDDKKYSYTGDDHYNYVSTRQYCLDKGIDLQYFTGDWILDEFTSIYYDDRTDVMLCQSVVIKDTYEYLNLYVDLVDGFTSDWLYQYDRLTEEAEIEGITMYYATEFVEEEWLYRTMVKFSYRDRVYRVQLMLLEEYTWIPMIAELIRR